MTPYKQRTYRHRGLVRAADWVGSYFWGYWDGCLIPAFKKLIHDEASESNVEASESNVVCGRWKVHFHHLGDDTVIEGCVVRDNPSPAFVAHGSDGTWLGRSR